MHRTVYAALLLLFASQVSAYEAPYFDVGLGLMRTEASFSLQTPHKDRFDIRLEDGVKLSLRQEFYEHFAIETALNHYGEGSGDRTENNRLYTVSASADSLTASLMINGDRKSWFHLYGKFGYSAWEGEMNGRINDATTGERLHLENRRTSGGAPYYAFGVHFQLPWRIALSLEREAINETDLDLVSYSATAEFHF